MDGTLLTPQSLAQEAFCGRRANTWMLPMLRATLTGKAGVILQTVLQKHQMNSTGRLTAKIRSLNEPSDSICNHLGP